MVVVVVGVVVVVVVVVFVVVVVVVVVIVIVVVIFVVIVVVVVVVVVVRRRRPLNVNDCRVTLEAFISTQKHSVAKSMGRTFQKYMTFKKDNNELLLYLLKNLATETAVYMRNR